jgi:hypothetical protein
MAKGFRLSAIITTIVLVAIGPGNQGEAFHSGSPGECKECHVGKNADGKEFDKNSGGIQRAQIPPPGKSADLKGSDESSTCLRCHQAPRGARQPAGYYVATADTDMYAGMPPLQLTPGGDFGWLKKNYSWGAPGGKGEGSPGERHGHNIVALDFGYEADRTYLTVPKGIYPASTLSCISCHDPHGIIGGGGAYRMLGGIGYEPSSARGIAFTVNPPTAVAPRVYNRSEALTDTRVAYGKGMSEWCVNCHTGGCSGSYGHPTCSSARCGREIFANYNAYVKSGDVNGMASASYTSLVPFEEGTEDKAVLAQHARNDGSFTSGPDSRSNVMCLTCHRAHASGWDHMARWNMATTFIVHKGVYPGVNNGSPAEYAQGRTVAEAQKAYYDRPSTRFAAYQRGLCNKCHVRD